MWGMLTSSFELDAAALTFLIVVEVDLVVLKMLESGRTGLSSRPERERAREGVDMMGQERTERTGTGGKRGC